MTKTQYRGLLTLALSLAVGAFCLQALAASTAKAIIAQASDPLTHAVHHQLQVLPFYSVFDYISFTISGNTVTLTGQVLRSNLKENAEAAVKSIEGVAAVANKIEVLPPSTSDDELRRNIYRAIFEDSVLARYATQPVPPIHILVRNGFVTLRGTVENEADIALTTKEVGKVAGITTLRNLLTVHKSDSAQK